MTVALADLHKQLKSYYSDIGRPSIDPELMIRMLIENRLGRFRESEVLRRSERNLCQEVELHLAYRWFCKLDLDEKVPHHSTAAATRPCVSCVASVGSVSVEAHWAKPKRYSAPKLASLLPKHKQSSLGGGRG